jgi:hypothetical protein
LRQHWNQRTFVKDAWGSAGNVASRTKKLGEMRPHREEAAFNYPTGFLYQGFKTNLTQPSSFFLKTRLFFLFRDLKKSTINVGKICETILRDRRDKISNNSNVPKVMVARFA